MKIFSRIVGVIYIIPGVFLAFFFLTAWATGGKNVLGKTSDYLQNNLSSFGIIGLVLAITGIVWSVNWFENIYKTKSISFDNPGGKIKVSLRAIEDYINSMLINHNDGIKALRVKTSLAVKGLETKIMLKLSSNQNIPETCSNIQELTKDYLQDTVGIERIANIEVYVTNITPGSETREPKAKPEPETKDDLYEEPL